MESKLQLLTKNKLDALSAYEKRVVQGQVAQADSVRRKFVERFSPEILQRVSGRDLLDLVHGDGTVRGLFYELEFGSTVANFGSIAGGSSLKFKVYRRPEGEFRRKGPGQSPVPCTDREAIDITQALVNSLLTGLAYAQELDLSAGDPATWQQFDERVRIMDEGLPEKTHNEKPILHLGWAHKYMALIRPEIFSFHHQERSLCQHLVRLGAVPEETGRYILDWQWGDIRANDPDIRDTNPALWMNACYDAFGFNTNYWRIGTEEGGATKIARWPAMRNGGFASVGWSLLGNMAELLEGLTGEPARERIKELLKGKAGNPGRSAKEWLNFYEGMMPGDRIAAMQGQMLHGVGIITGPYEYHPNDIQPHHRTVDWRAEPDEVWPGFPGYMTTIYSFSEKYYDASKVEKYVATGEGLSGPQLPDPSPTIAFQQQLDTADPEAFEPFEIVPLTEMEQRVKDILERKGQVILYGPPGTGKTYHARRTAQELISRDMCRGKAWANLNDQEKERVNQRIHFCTFHPAYAYEDFIEGYRPTLLGGVASFELRAGLFKMACAAAKSEPAVHHILIVDEINRGNIPAILGELITLLEADKRENLSLTLTLSGEAFTVPRNLWIIGTMNTADRSISLLDAALRRRFGFIELLPDTAYLGTKIEDLQLDTMLLTINERIRKHVTRNARELQIGHAYFMRNGSAIKDKIELQHVLRDDIIPLICEYCFEDYRIVAKILGADIIDVNLLAPSAAVVNNSDAMYRAILSQVSSEAITLPSSDQEGEATADSDEETDSELGQE